MPLLDVTDVLEDPDYQDSSLVRRRMAQSVGSDGLAVNTPTDLAFSGVVTNDAGDVLNRQPDGSYISGSITIHSHTILTDGSAGTDADIVLWRGRAFTVKSVGDWSTYGAGFTMAVCEPASLSGS